MFFDEVTYSATYRFENHKMSDYDEAHWIINYHIEHAGA